MRAYQILTGYGFGFQRLNESVDPTIVSARMMGPMKLPTELLARFTTDADDSSEVVVFAVKADGIPTIQRGSALVRQAQANGEEYVNAQVLWYGGSDQKPDYVYCPAAIARAAQWDD